MFVWSVKASKSRLLPLVILIALLLAILIVGVWFPAERTMITSATPTVDSDEAGAAYLRSLGYAVELPAVSIREVRLPDSLDEALTAYNALQKQAGFDWAGFVGQRLRCRTYDLSEHPAGVKAQIHLYTYDGRVIGGDVSACDGSFIDALRPVEGPSLDNPSRKESTTHGTTG